MRTVLRFLPLLPWSVVILAVVWVGWAVRGRQLMFEHIGFLAPGMNRGEVVGLMGSPSESSTDGRILVFESPTRLFGWSTPWVIVHFDETDRVSRLHHGY